MQGSASIVCYGSKGLDRAVYTGLLQNFRGARMECQCASHGGGSNFVTAGGRP